jgi:hypothetical protein
MENASAAAAVVAAAALAASCAYAGAASKQQKLEAVPPLQQGEESLPAKTLPLLKAGRVHDLEMSFLSWRDVRPYHLAGCTCSVCNGTMPSHSPRPMEARSDALVPLIQEGADALRKQTADTQKISSDYYYAAIPPSEFGYRPYPEHPGRPFKVYAGFHM